MADEQTQADLRTRGQREAERTEGRQAMQAKWVGNGFIYGAEAAEYRQEESQRQTPKPIESDAT